MNFVVKTLCNIALILSFQSALCLAQSPSQSPSPAPANSPVTQTPTPTLEPPVSGETTNVVNAVTIPGTIIVAKSSSPSVTSQGFFEKLRDYLGDDGVSNLEITQLVLQKGGTHSLGSAYPIYEVVKVPQFEKLGEEGRRLTESLVEALHADGFSVSLDYEVKIFSNDPHFPPAAGSWGQSFYDQWPLDKLMIEEAWTMSRGADQIIAVIDTGVDYTHPDIAANIVPGWGWDFVNRDADPMDDHGHGTHVAGIIAASADNGIGIAGVAPEAKILPLKVLGAGGGGTMSAVAEAVIYATDNGASVINMSLGARVGSISLPYLEDALSYAHKKGVTIVAAAGNSTQDLIDFSPANSPYVISVGATTSEDLTASFSNYGDKLDLTAPGGGDDGPIETIVNPSYSVLSLLSSQAPWLLRTAWVVNSHYLRLSGTSMASPHVAGVAALVRSARKWLTPEQVRQVLRLSADDVGEPGVDIRGGYGRVNAAKALKEPVPPTLFISKLDFSVVDHEPELKIFGTVSGGLIKSWALDYVIRDTPSAPIRTVAVASGIDSFNERLIATWNLDGVGLVSGTFGPTAGSLRLRATTTTGDEFTFLASLRLSLSEINKPVLNNLGRFATKGDASIEIHGTFARPDIERYTVGLYSDASRGAWDGRPGSKIKANIALPPHEGSRVHNGLLATLDPRGLPAWSYFVVLEIPGVSIADSPKIRLHVDPTYLANWPFRVERSWGNLGWLDHVVTYDLDHNGASEIILPYGDEIKVLTGAGENLPGWPSKAPDGEFLAIGPSIADLDGDGDADIVTPTSSGSLLRWNSRGELKSHCKPPSGAFYGQRPVLTDLERDGKSEIVLLQGRGTPLRAAPFPDPSIVVLNAACETLLEIGPFEGEELRWTVADLDLDHTQEFIIAAGPAVSSDLTEYNSAVLRIYDHRGLLERQATLKSADPIFSYMYDLTGELLAINLDNEPELEILVPGIREPERIDFIFAFNHDASPYRNWRIDTRGYPDGMLRISQLIAGDVTGDGLPEIIGVSPRIGFDIPGELYVFDRNGNYRQLEGLGWFYNRKENTPIIADVTGDGIAEIVVGVENRVHAISITPNTVGTPVPPPGFPKWVSNGARNGVGVADINGDEKLDLVAIDEVSYVYAWGLNSSIDMPCSWPMYGANTYATRQFNSVLRCRDVLTPLYPWQNLRDPLDVNDDAKVTALDALTIINELNTRGPRALAPATPPAPFLYFDTNGDNRLTATDALRVINFLHSAQSSTGASIDGESLAGLEELLQNSGAVGHRKKQKRCRIKRGKRRCKARRRKA